MLVEIPRWQPMFNVYVKHFFAVLAIMTSDDAL
jgi:hypothetical protein